MIIEHRRSSTKRTLEILSLVTSSQLVSARPREDSGSEVPDSSKRLGASSTWLLPEQWRVGGVVSHYISHEIVSSCDALPHSWMSLQARVGIGPFRRGFRDKTTQFAELLKHYLT